MSLRIEKTGAIAHLLIDRAARRNAFTQAMWEALPARLEEGMGDPAVRVLIVRAAEPGAFSAGADIAEFSKGARDPEWRARNRAAISAAQYALARAPKPVIAAIAGDCIGGGCGLAIACDMRVASPQARLGITPAKLGLVYSLHDTKLLVDLVGPSQAKLMLMSAALLPGPQAQAIGLVDMIADDPVAASVSLAETIAANSPHSVRETKAMVRRILDGQADDDATTHALFDQAFTLPDFEEGASAFLGKRAPRF